jgi:hypothetical protein
LGGHRLLFYGILQQFDQAVGQTLRFSRRIKPNCQIFALRHLPKINQVGAHDWHSMGACEMRHSATSRRRGIRHHSNARALEKIGQRFFRNVSAKFDPGISSALPPD